MPLAHAIASVVACTQRQPRKTVGHEFLQRLGHWKRLRMVEVLLERPSELERIERIPARDLVNAEQRRPGKHPSGPLMHESLAARRH